ncbi:T9SS type A sorting domain-containing protein [Pontibacter saemangeumensis]|uniref:T9SS type A sorting domain-containing protein n=1 Tax=Pontibacter saemangeumensis TaxID=1084525 RepID=A0ABP8L9V0_9BACT
MVSGPITNLTIVNTTANLTYRARKINGTVCDATSPTSASVTVRPQPATTDLTFVNNTQNVCANASASFSLNGTNSNYNYQLVNEATNALVGSALQGVTSGSIELSSGPVTTNTTFGLRVTVRSSETTPCSTTLPTLAFANITSPSTTRAVFSENSKTCVGGSTSISVSTEPNNDFEYKVYRRVGASPNTATDPLLGTFRGNGNIQSVSTGTLNTAGTETFYVTVRRLTNNSCGTLTIVNTAQVEVTNNPLGASAGADITACGSSVVLNGNDVSPGIGTWSRISGPTEVTFSSPNNPNATVQGLRTGTYVLRWTAQTTCGNSSATTFDDVSVTINCDASYTLAIPKYKDEYIRGEALATATDPDGAITGASITVGSVPPGVVFNAVTGAFTVDVPSALVEGNYRLSVRLVDNLGGVTLTAITLRIYGMSPAIVPLPVELVYFTATVQNGTVNLQWLTASEKDNKEFVVERSADGKTFEGIGTVQGNGNSSVPINYSFADKTPMAGTAYYRLKQVDLSGEFAYSNVIAVSAEGLASDMQLQAYPNPFQDELNITVTAPNNGSASLKLFDVQGRLVHTGTIELQAGLNEYTLPLRSVRKGMYILRLTGNGINGTIKVLKN